MKTNILGQFCKRERHCHILNQRVVGAQLTPPKEKAMAKVAISIKVRESTTANNTERHRGGRRGRRRGDKKGIRPVLHRLNAKLRNRNRHGRDKSKNRDDSNRENNKYDGAMSELPTITNLTLDI